MPLISFSVSSDDCSDCHALSALFMGLSRVIIAVIFSLPFSTAIKFQGLLYGAQLSK